MSWYSSQPPQYQHHYQHLYQLQQEEEKEYNNTMAVINNMLDEAYNQIKVTYNNGRNTDNQQIQQIQQNEIYHNGV